MLYELVSPDQLSEIPEACHESIKLKYHQVKYFLFGVCVIYMTRQWTIIYRIADYFADFEDEFLYFKMDLARDAIEMMAYSLILYVFRPRRVWPEFYGVDIVTAKDSIFRSK